MAIRSVLFAARRIVEKISAVFPRLRVSKIIHPCYKIVAPFSSFSLKFTLLKPYGTADDDAPNHNENYETFEDSNNVFHG